MSAAQFRELDEYTIRHEVIESYELMERAALACVARLESDFPSASNIVVWSGIGNNGGDGLAMARLLSERNKKVSVIICGDPDKGSPDFIRNLRLVRNLPIPIQTFNAHIDPGIVKSADVYIDCLFGTGLNRPVEGDAKQCIGHINTCSPVVSIDLPSGLAADPESFNPYGTGGASVKATFTYTFDSYKRTCLLDDLSEYYGKIAVLDIGLNKPYKTQLETSEFFWTISGCRALLKARSIYLHKRIGGHAFLAVGKKGMMGAAMLSAGSASRTGIGLLTVHTPASQVSLIQQSIPEALILASQDPDFIDLKTADTNKYDAIGIGCGIGTNGRTGEALHHFLENCVGKHHPLVLDADALNIMASKPELLDMLTELPVLLTPHVREFDRLFGEHQNQHQRLGTLRKVCSTRNLHILLKGATSWLGVPNGTLHAFHFPNDGLSKGGSGDVLTGILTGFLAQGYSILHSVCIGMGLFAHSATQCAKAKSTYTMLPGDLRDYFPTFFVNNLSDT